jgi:hypothetical protein
MPARGKAFRLRSWFGRTKGLALLAATPEKLGEGGGVLAQHVITVARFRPEVLLGLRRNQAPALRTDA